MLTAIKLPVFGQVPFVEYSKRHGFECIGGLGTQGTGGDAGATTLARVGLKTAENPREWAC